VLIKIWYCPAGPKTTGRVGGQWSLSYSSSFLLLFYLLITSFQEVFHFF